MVIVTGQSNLESPIPSPIDSEASLGFEKRDSTHINRMTDSCVLFKLAEYNYHYEMTCFLEDLEREGPEGIVLPYKPKANMKSLLGKNQTASKQLSGLSLHEYLIQKIVSNNPVNSPTCLSADQFTDLENMLPNLKAGYEILEINNSVSLFASLDYGNRLIAAFELHSIEKLAVKISATWEEWLEPNVGIQDSYARKLREIAKLLDQYSRFRKLGLSFSEVYQRRKQVQSMLITSHLVAQYRQQAS